MNLKSISATSVNLYETDPLLWKYKYVYKLMELPNDAFEIGTLYHKLLNDYHRLNKSKDTILAELRAEVIKSNTSEEIDRFGLLRKLFEKYLEVPILDETLSTEYRFLRAVNFVPVPLYGFIDRICEGRIIDYKTTSEDYTEQMVLDNIQTDFYSYIMWIDYNKQRIPTVTFHVNNKKKCHRSDYKPQVITVQRTPEDMIKFEERIKQFHKNIMANKFERKLPRGHWLYKPYE